MALNITFGGYVYNKDSVTSNLDVNYQGFFFPNGTASSSSKWNDVRTVESTGYYNINLGDADWLGQEGTALSNSIVVLVFWKSSPLTTDRNALCGVLTEWGAFELLLDGSSVYTYDAQTRDNIIPYLSWSDNVPEHGYVDTFYSFMNNSHDIHSWEFEGISTPSTVTMHHWRTRYGENIQLINTIQGTSYYWGNGESTLDLEGAANTTYSWGSAGTYDVDINVYDTCNDTVSGTSQVTIYWHAPSPNITLCASDGTPISGNTVYPPDTPVYFKYSGDDIDNTITSIDWVINDSGTYGNTDTINNGAGVNDVISHVEGTGTSWDGHTATSGSFTNPGNHTVQIVVNWYDGHSNQSITYDEIYNQQKFSGPPSPDLVCNEATGQNISTPDTLVTFNYTGNNPDSRITSIDWVINDSGTYGDTDTIISEASVLETVYHLEGMGTSWCGHTATSGSFTNPGGHAVSIGVNWNDGWDDNTVNYSETFFQDLFTGPQIYIEQVPSQAVVGSGVSFNNLSISTDLVGMALPDCAEYDWEFNDDGNISVELNKDIGYTFTRVPNSANCEVQLCADWSNGWDAMTECLTKDVVFETTVTVTPEDCFYNLNIIGTSSDGSVNGYKWEIYKDSTCLGTCVSGSSGSWDLVWTSPISLDQNDKNIYFTDSCCYRIYGYVYGNGATTSDYEDIYIEDVCVISGTGGAVCSGVAPQHGFIQLEYGWQLVAVPVKYGYWDNNTHSLVHDDTTRAKFKNYIVDQIEDLYGPGSVELANTFTGDNQAFYSYVVNSTPDSSPHNFNLVYEDGPYLEIAGFWIKSTSSGTMLVEWGE